MTNIILWFKKIDHQHFILKELHGKKNSSINADHVFPLTKQELKGFNLFCYGLIIYTIGYAPSMCNVTAISGAALQGIQLTGLVILISGIFGLVKFRLEDKYIENVLQCRLATLLRTLRRPDLEVRWNVRDNWRLMESVWMILKMFIS